MKKELKKVLTLGDMKTLRLLFWICWVVYFIAYIGRLNYSASMVEIGTVETFTKSQLGMVSTVMFISYGAGQLFSGIIGDYVSPRLLIFIGTIGSACCNLFVGTGEGQLLLALFWGLNGIFQSLIWSPMLRIFSIYMPSDFLYRACVNIQSSCALGTCVTYIVSSAVISIGGWRAVFLLTFFLLLFAAIAWEFVIRHIEKTASKVKHLPPSPNVQASATPPPITEVVPITAKHYFLGSGLLIFVAAVIAMGILKEGVMTWVPGYIMDVFHTGSSFAIFITAVLPLVNLSGVFIIPLLGKKFNNEAVIAGILFGVGSCALLGLMLFGSSNIVLAILFFSVVTSCMVGVNTALISLVPTYFIRYNKTSTTVGILNSMAYIGSAISGYGIGLLAQWAGWGAAQLIWLCVSVLGTVCCLFACVKWGKFKKE